MSAKLETFTDQNWQKDVLGADKPVLVDFWAEWCKPCLAMVPDLEAVAEAFAGRLRVGKLNVEENGQVAEQYSIRPCPPSSCSRGARWPSSAWGRWGRTRS